MIQDVVVQCDFLEILSEHYESAYPFENQSKNQCSTISFCVGSLGTGPASPEWTVTGDSKPELQFVTKLLMMVDVLSPQAPQVR